MQVTFSFSISEPRRFPFDSRINVEVTTADDVETMREKAKQEIARCYGYGRYRPLAPVLESLNLI